MAKQNRLLLGQTLVKKGETLCLVRAKRVEQRPTLILTAPSAKPAHSASSCKPHARHEWYYNICNLKGYIFLYLRV